MCALRHWGLLGSQGLRARQGEEREQALYCTVLCASLNDPEPDAGACVLLTVGCLLLAEAVISEENNEGSEHCRQQKLLLVQGGGRGGAAA